ncbi:MAG: GTPase Era [Acetobacterales bacterium]
MAEVAVPAEPRCGFVAIVGAPNVGKSTLLNQMVGAKVSIVSPKVQTTRTRVLGILAEGAAQLIFVDTPGIFRPRRRLDRAMVAAAWSGATDADRVLLVVDAARGVDDDTAGILERLQETGRKADLVLNKVDLVKPPVLLALTERLTAAGRFENVFMVSALTGDGVRDVVRNLAQAVPEGIWLYPADQLTDVADRFLAAEITREQLFRQLHEELPYATAVETEGWQERRDGSLRIEQVVYVERSSQRSIVLGKGGAQVKAIGAAARHELEAIFECRVHLFLFVKVKKKWAEERGFYRDLGLDYDV